MADYAAILAVHYPDTKWGTGNGTYDELAATWADTETALPAKVTLDALAADVDADIALIDDMPSKTELEDVSLGVVTGAPADAILARRAAAITAQAKF